MSTASKSFYIPTMSLSPWHSSLPWHDCPPWHGFARIIVIICLANIICFANADRPYTLRTMYYSPTLYELPAMRNNNGIMPLLYWSAADKSAMIALSPILAFDVRGGKTRGGEAFGDTIQGYEGGLFVRGYKDSAEFWLDARMFTENHSANPPQSWDREFMENQGDKGIKGEAKYSSYTRYRGHFILHLGFANLDFARDAVHWGPGYYNNLTLNQASVPYNQLGLSTKIGPLTVMSLYGDLDAGENSMNKVYSRNLYGHRYELELSDLVGASSLTLGVSEIMVLYDLNKPWLFVPIVPLFAEKGNFSEDNNNGAISFDFNYRFPLASGHNMRVYSEFFLDDMESPTSLLRNDNIEAKWAWMAGIAYTGEFGQWHFGSLAEYARMEPYVLSHFKPHTAQIAHLDYPIGLPAGANSQTIDWVIYAHHAEHLQLQLRQELAWKGSDKGSALNDTTPSVGHHSTAKRFLRDKQGKRVSPDYSLTPVIAYIGNRYAISTEYSFFDRQSFCSRIMFLW